MTPHELQSAIKSDPAARRRVYEFLDRLAVRANRRSVSGASLAAVCGASPRTWRHWVTRGSIPTAAYRLLVVVSGLEFD